MKKMITLLIAFGGLLSVQAQTSKEDARRVVLGAPKNGNKTTKNGRDVVLGGDNGNNSRSYPNNRTYPNSRNYPYGSREAQRDQVNREYDMKINSIRNNGQLSQSEKDRMIQQLEKDRARRLHEIDKGYNKTSRKQDDDQEEDDHNDHNNGHHDNGKHSGWEKGKGNQGKHKHDD